VGTGSLERRLILGTAGHIDHGKTALVRALTGVDTDRLPEEKRRGITIDLGFAPLVLDGVGTIGIVDVPGHEGFVRTMLAGASGIDLALLVVAADEGVMPQTREHLDILSLLEIPRGVIAITKSDLVDEEWSALVADEVRALASGTLLHNAEIVFVSANTGLGIERLKDAIAAAARDVRRDRRSEDLFRMPVDRAFTMKGTGTVVTGTVWSGTVKRDAIVRIEPGGKIARVRGIQTHGIPVDVAMPGTRTALALAGCDVSDVPRGTSLVVDNNWITTHEIDAVLRFTDPEFEPTPRTRVRVHIGTADAGARLSRLRPAGEGTVTARLVLDEPVVARGGDRLVLRIASPARTVGGGQVIDPYPRHRNAPSLADTVDDRVAQFLRNAGNEGVVMGVLPVRAGSSPADVSSALSRTGAVVIGERAWARSAVSELEGFIERFVAMHLANHPLDDGVSLQTLRAAAKAPQEVIDHTLGRLVEQGRIDLKGSNVRPAGWVSKLGSVDQSLSDSILHEICTRAAEPPSVGELTARFGGSVPAMLRRLEREGQIERVSEDRYYARDAVARMVGSLRSLDRGRKYTPAELREVIGVSRKYLIPFLEFCDRKGITARADDGRFVRAFDA
jgi:selenocysteine-specific elongation factor